MYNIVQEYLYFHGTRAQKVLLIVSVGRGISSKSDTNLFQGFLFTIPFQPYVGNFDFFLPYLEVRL